MKLQDLAKLIMSTEQNDAYESPLPKNPWKDHKMGMEKRLDPLPSSAGMPIFYRDFTLEELPDHATVTASAYGTFEMFCNGKRVGHKMPDGTTVYDEMKPGHTLYTARILSYSYDLKPYLKAGENRLLAVCTPGWYMGRIAFGTYGSEPLAFICDMAFSHGEETWHIPTDESWMCFCGGRILFSDIWDGELQDMRRASFVALSRPDRALNASPARILEKECCVTPHIGPAVQLRPGLIDMPEQAVVWCGTTDNGTDYGEIIVSRTESTSRPFPVAVGEAVYYDMGQNLVGREAVRIKGRAGTRVAIVFAEMLNDSGSAERGNDGPKGSLYTQNYRSAKARTEYILSGSEEGDLCTTLFTFYGFRYMQIVATDDIEVLSAKVDVIGSVTQEVGQLTTSNALVNQLISNIIWGQRGNYLSIPTDCPQRDERLGWTGDTQIFCRAAAYQADVKGFFHKWMQDVRDSQGEDGHIPDVVPYACIFAKSTGAAWGDAAIIVPYTIYLMYGNTDIIRENMDMMRRYMAWLAARPDYMGAEPRYLDWLAFDPTQGNYIARVYYAHDARLMAVMARAIGEEEEALAYEELYTRIRDAFIAEHLDQDGMPKQKTQTAYILALAVDFFAPEKKAQAIAELKAKIIENGYRLSTGFVGTGWLCQTLSACGEDNLAYSLLMQTECPSWLYSVLQGATTIWERWNSYTLDKGFGDVGMNSFNHYAYGVVAEWMYRYMAGIEADVAAPGFRHIILQPRPDTRTADELPKGQMPMTMVNARFDSPVGRICSRWQMGDGFIYETELPEGAHATLYLPLFGQNEYL
ncbi:MAG: family 78 glycoside hydrolase catalytic domain [Clostridia bacterium]|nr:family 78 glycoside hydrolase catalytic domain [Clostridia bacterium]